MNSKMIVFQGTKEFQASEYHATKTWEEKGRPILAVIQKTFYIKNKPYYAGYDAGYGQVIVLDKKEKLVANGTDSLEFKGYIIVNSGYYGVQQDEDDYTSIYQRIA